MIFVDADVFISVMFKKAFQATLIVPVHEVARDNHKTIINEGFHRYLNKL